MSHPAYRNYEDIDKSPRKDAKKASPRRDSLIVALLARILA